MPRILVIDNEPLVRAVLRCILEGHGYTVLEAQDGRAGLTLWRSTPVDLVLTEIFMPEVDGIEVIVQLTRLWPQAKIIAMTGGAKTNDVRSSVAPAALELGAGHILAKPFTKQALLAAIAEVLNPKGGDSQRKGLMRDLPFSRRELGS
jgi:CheY-like chemotaxis protein